MGKFCKVMLIQFCMEDFILQLKKWDRKVFCRILGDLKIVYKFEIVYLNDKMLKNLECNDFFNLVKIIWNLILLV